MLKKILTTCFLCLVLWGALQPTQGFATSYPYDPTAISNIGGFLSGLEIKAELMSKPSLSGLWEVTPLGAEAGFTNLFKDGNTVIFDNHALSDQFSVFKPADLASSVFVEIQPGKKIKEFFLVKSEHVQIYSLLDSWALGALSLEKGSLLLAFNDRGGDSDFDDFILAARPTSATPIPGAIWLLGSGLIGIVGLRRFTGA